MDNPTENDPIPEEIRQGAQAIIKKAVDALGSHFEEMDKAFKAFEEQQQSVRERIQHGARRTSGRIV